jgi:hypothetical protein
MKFAAGVTISGIASFLLLELAKLIAPALAAWILGGLVLILKAVLILLTLGVAVTVIGAGIFFYRRTQRARGEA